MNNSHYLTAFVSMAHLCIDPTEGMNSSELYEYNQQCSSYEPDFDEVIRRESMSELRFVSKEEQHDNFQEQLEAIEAAKNYSELAVIGKFIFRATDAANGGNPFFFDWEEKKHLWKVYGEKKDSFRTGALKEVEQLLNSVDTVRELKQLKAQIYGVRVLTKEEKREFYDAADVKIQQLEGNDTTSYPQAA